LEPYNKRPDIERLLLKINILVIYAFYRDSAAALIHDDEICD